MNPAKNEAIYHSMILTEQKPVNVFHFEERVDIRVRQRYIAANSSIFIEYRHGLGKKISDFCECLKEVEKCYGHLSDQSTFTIKKESERDVGKIITIIWRNPQSRRLLRNSF